MKEWLAIERNEFDMNQRTIFSHKVLRIQTNFAYRTASVFKLIKHFSLC